MALETPRQHDEADRSRRRFAAPAQAGPGTGARSALATQSAALLHPGERGPVGAHLRAA
jgi:hypothetical protein